MSTKKIWATLDTFVEGGDILGRKVANVSFLTAFLRADPYDGYHFFLTCQDHIATMTAWLADHFPRLHSRGAFRFALHTEVHKHLAATEFHCFHLSDPFVHPVGLARLRNAYSPRIFPITGTTHTLSYERYMREYLNHLWPGATSRDVIITTSQSAHDVLSATFAALQKRYGCPEGFLRPPRLHRIPLGVDENEFPAPHERWDFPASRGSAPVGGATPDSGVPPYTEAPAGNGAALAVRERLGIGDGLMLLCLARISPYSKMDLAPLIAALKRAEGLGLPAGGHTLVVAGWAEPGDPLPGALTGYARSLGIRLVPVERPSHAERKALFAAADIFLSPSDNLQETFGLTLVEAGLSGLPVIASDFDGYRDTVVHGTTGLLIPTLGFAATTETNLLSYLWFDNQYHLKLAQSVSVDVPALAEAIARLGSDAPLRRTMGRAARAHCLARFSWAKVIPRYVDLWDSLNAAPLSAEEEQRARASLHPLGMDFGLSFATHCTAALTPEHAAALTVKRSVMGDALYRKAIPPFTYAGCEHIMDEDALRRLLVATRRPVNAAELLLGMARRMGAAPAGDAPGTGAHAAADTLAHLNALLSTPLYERAAALLLWALKQDYLELVRRREK